MHCRAESCFDDVACAGELGVWLAVRFEIDQAILFLLLAHDGVDHEVHNVAEVRTGRTDAALLQEPEGRSGWSCAEEQVLHNVAPRKAESLA
jgi:hypothetical protein